MLGPMQDLGRCGTRGVTRLDGAQGKKQVWQPHVCTWCVWKQMYCIEEYLWYFGDFLVPSAFIWCLGNCVPLSPSLHPGAGPLWATTLWHQRAQLTAPRRFCWKCFSKMALWI